MIKKYNNLIRFKIINYFNNLNGVVVIKCKNIKQNIYIIKI